MVHDTRMGSRRKDYHIHPDNTIRNSWQHDATECYNSKQSPTDTDEFATG